MWDLFNSWGAVIAWIAIMAVIYGLILYKRKEGVSNDGA
jgi:hypothetical protein